jgi:hypothetical protein
VSTPHHGNDIRRPSLGFDATTAKELAEIMAALDYKLFRRIPVSERLGQDFSLVLIVF